MKNIHEWIWDYITHLETIFTYRTSFFLVAEATFFVAYATIPKYVFNQIIIAGLGFVIRLIWMFANYWTYIRLNALGNGLDNLSQKPIWYSEYQTIKSSTNWPNKNFNLTQNYVLGIIMPFFILCAWNIFIFRCIYSLILIILFIVILIIISIQLLDFKKN